MPAYTANASATYRQRSVLTATPGQLVEGIYGFCKRHLTEARIARDPTMIDKLSELREAWVQVAS